MNRSTIEHNAHYSITGSHGRFDCGTTKQAILLAEIDPDTAGSPLILPEPKSFLEQMFESGNIAAPLQKISPTIAKELGYLTVLSRLFREPALLMLPYQVQIR